MSLTENNWAALIDAIVNIANPIFTQAAQQTQQVERKADGSLLTQTDLALQQAISQVLQQHFPDIAILGEEMTEAEQSAILAAGNCWLLDPLDGTSNFSHNIPVYSVSLALYWQGEIIAGMVFDPNRQECFHALKGQGAFLNGQRLDRRSDTLSNIKHAMAVIDTKRLPNTLALAIATEHPYHSQRSFGSVAIDWCWLAAGRIQTYVHGKQKLWDFSAGALIAQEAGCLSNTLTGESILASPITLTARSAVGATPSLAGAWQDWLASHNPS